MLDVHVYKLKVNNSEIHPDNIAVLTVVDLKKRVTLQ